MRERKWEEKENEKKRTKKKTGEKIFKNGREGLMLIELLDECSVPFMIITVWLDES